MTKAATIADRTLPHNLDAERAVIGAIMLHNDAYEVASSIVVEEDFYRDAHRRIFGAIDRLLEWKGGRADMITIREELTRRGELDEVGGPVYLSAMIDGVPRSTNVDEYARIVKEKAQLRQIIFAANKTLTAAYDAEEPAEEILANADRAFVDIQAAQGRGRMLSLAETAPALYGELERRAASRGTVTGVTSGFSSVDALTFGWQAGDLSVIAARPSVGKTTFVGNVAISAARSGKRGAFFSYEMRRQQLELRMLSMLSGVPLSRILAGDYMAPDWPKLSEALVVMGALPIEIDDSASSTVQDIRKKCRLLKSEGGLDYVVIDYVQLIPGSLQRRGATRNEEVTDISRRLKVLSDELAAPILLLSQLSRANEKRPDPRPRLSDLRESGALEQDADNVFFLHRRNHREGGLTYGIMEKQRNGPTGTVKLSLDRDVVTFSDAPELEEPAPEPRKKAGKKVVHVGGDS